MPARAASLCSSSLILLALVLVPTACDTQRSTTRAGTPGIMLDALDEVSDEEAAFAPLVGESEPDAIPRRYVVVLDKDADDDDLDALLGAGAGWITTAKVDHVYRNAFAGFAAELDAGEVEALRADPRVAYVEADREVWSTATWGLDRIDQDDLPLDGDYEPGPYDGTGVDAYIVDTGIRDSHVLFADNMGEGFTAVPGGTGDCDGHGTHVAGTVGGGQYGVAPGVTLHAVRVLGCDGKGSLSAVAAGLDWIAGHADGPAVVNMSLTGPGSWYTDQATRALVEDGIVVVAAAGNDNSDACYYSPARVDEVITVGATRYNDQRWGSSNWGSCVDLFAPGASITSAYVYSDASLATLSGTSMASPHVAGVAALYLEAYPDATPAQVVADILAVAVEDKVGNPAGSPNLLLSAHIPVAEPEPEPEPGPTCPGCTVYEGTLGATGEVNWQPDGNYFQLGAAATLHGVLSGPADADFDLALYRWDGSQWAKVVGSESADSEEAIEHPASAGYYVWRVRSYSGAGSYAFAMNTP